MALSKEKSKLVQRLRSPRLRAREGLFLVEGVRCVGEFLQATLPLTPRFAIASPRLLDAGGGPELLADLRARGLLLLEVETGELNALAHAETTQGVLLVVEEPRCSWPPWPDPGSRRLLLLDGIQDPGNVGTLIRAARAFGLDAVLALDGTADPWGPKTVRSGAGAHAHVPVFRMPWTEARDRLGDMGLPILVAEADGTDVRGWSGPPGWALVLGNEGAGVRAEVQDLAEVCLAIPMADAVDSLNVAVAGAILLFALTPPTPQAPPQQKVTT
jgi:TrmH family RNA methyltransferase